MWNTKGKDTWILNNFIFIQDQVDLMWQSLGDHSDPRKSYKWYPGKPCRKWYQWYQWYWASMMPSNALLGDRCQIKYIYYRMVSIFIFNTSCDLIFHLSWYPFVFVWESNNWLSSKVPVLAGLFKFFEKYQVGVLWILEEKGDMLFWVQQDSGSREVPLCQHRTLYHSYPYHTS